MVSIYLDANAYHQIVDRLYILCSFFISALFCVFFLSIFFSLFRSPTFQKKLASKFSHSHATISVTVMTVMIQQVWVYQLKTAKYENDFIVSILSVQIFNDSSEDYVAIVKTTYREHIFLHHFYFILFYFWIPKISNIPWILLVPIKIHTHTNNKFSNAKYRNVRNCTQTQFFRRIIFYEVWQNSVKHAYSLWILL